MNSQHHRIEFGWLDLELKFDTPSLRVSPLPDRRERVGRVKNSNIYGKEYLYLPVKAEPETGVLVPTTRFDLLTTHEMVLKACSADKDRDLFLTAVLGFLVGLRLVPAGFGHLNRIRHTPRCSASFFATQNEIASIMEATLMLWDTRGASVGNRIFAAIHWFLTTEAAYEHQFEKFTFLYSVLDALHVAAWEADLTYRAVSGSRSRPEQIPHAERVRKLAAHFNSPLPDDLDAIINQRNELIHEARLAGHPMGFIATPEIERMGHSMAFFIQQIILGLLNVQCDFRSDTYCFQQHGLRLKP